MSWEQDILSLYDTLVSNGESITPLYHAKRNFDIEVTIDTDGKFVEARKLVDDKKNGVFEKRTIIPVTESSESRTSGAVANPLHEKLSYLVYDANDDKDKYGLYTALLNKWLHYSNNSALIAVYTYITGRTIAHDISGISDVSEPWVRFRVIGYSCPELWNDAVLVESWQSFYRDILETETNTSVCYLSGNSEPQKKNHASALRNDGSKGKIISSKDDDAYDYVHRGLFSCADEAMFIGYETSEKLHKTIVWLRENRGVTVDGRLFILFKNGSHETMNDIIGGCSYKEESDLFDDLSDKTPIVDTGAVEVTRFKKSVFGHNTGSTTDNETLYLCFDEPVPGRLSLIDYSKFADSSLAERIRTWHDNLSMRDKTGRILYPSAYDIIDCVFGEYSGKFVVMDKSLMKSAMTTLVHAILYNRSIPEAYIRNICRNVTKTHAFKATNQKDRDAFAKLLRVACSLIRKNNIEFGKEVTSMSLDMTSTDRNYLYGRLLAVLDYIEVNAQLASGNRHETSAHRLWSIFSVQPYSTTKKILDAVQPYYGNNRAYFDKLVSSIISMFDIDKFEIDTPLSPTYILGYYHQLNSLWAKKSENNNVEVN